MDRYTSYYLGSVLRLEDEFNLEVDTLTNQLHHHLKAVLTGRRPPPAPAPPCRSMKK